MLTSSSSSQQPSAGENSLPSLARYSAANQDMNRTSIISRSNRKRLMGELKSSNGHSNHCADLSTNHIKLLQGNGASCRINNMQVVDRTTGLCDVAPSRESKVLATTDVNSTNGSSLSVTKREVYSGPQADTEFVIESQEGDVLNGGYIRRLAARNAMACVNAMFSSSAVRKKKLEQDTRTMNFTEKLIDSSAGSILGKRKEYDENTVMDSSSKKRKSPTKLQSDKREEDHEPAAVTSTDAIKLSSPLSSYSDSSSSDSDQEGSINGAASVGTLLSCKLDHEHSEDCYSTPYSLLGILYNGDCVHSNSRFYLKSESSFATQLTQRIVPVVVPSCKKNIISMKDKGINSKTRPKQRSVKGDNGWLPIGSPIKTISINQGKGKKIQRKYFIGIKRKQEVIFSRDSILLKSGSKKNDVPFVAKISSIWQESGGLMVTVFWYYRKEDTDASTSSQFVEMEVMASQHYDDISVACIDDKCHVLGLTEFCRFRAYVKQRPFIGKAAQLVRPSSSKSSQARTSISCFEHLLLSEVYVCHRAYNHIAGKVIKVNSMYN